MVAAAFLLMKDDLFSVLTCPRCGKELKVDKYRKFLHCMHCDIQYPIRDGVPDLRLPDEKENHKKK